MRLAKRPAAIGGLATHQPAKAPQTITTMSDTTPLHTPNRRTVIWKCGGACMASDA